MCTGPVAIVTRMSKPANRHPVRRLALVLAAVAVVVAVRNAVADKGGTYDPNDPGRR